MSGAAPKRARGDDPVGFVTLALGMIKNPGLRSYVREQLVAAQTPRDREAALAILMENVGWPNTAKGRQLH